VRRNLRGIVHKTTGLSEAATIDKYWTMTEVLEVGPKVSLTECLRCFHEADLGFTIVIS
jgi:hypothetical protein